MSAPKVPRAPCPPATEPSSSCHLEDEIRRLRVRVRDLEAQLGNAAVTPPPAEPSPLPYQHELLHKLVAHSPVILWSVDAEGIIELSEGRGLDRQGFQGGELVGRSIFDVYQAHPGFLANVRRALAGESFSAQNETGGATYERWFEPVKDAQDKVVGVIGVSVDITEQKRVERALQQQNELLNTALETIPDGIQVLDRDLKLVAWNAKLWEVLELDGVAVTSAADPGKAFRYALATRGEYGDGDTDELVASRERIARSPVPVRYERQLVSGRWMECRGSPVPGGGYLAVYRDIHERKLMEQELERLANRDELTGLRNRRSLLRVLESELERIARYPGELSVLLLDLDHFKTVNDRHGHAAGDAVLREASRVMTTLLRDVDAVGRIGGEEFAAVLPATGAEGAVQVGERLREAVARMRVVIGDCRIGVTTSVGVATSWSGADAEALLARCDDALYTAKHRGRNQVVSYAE